MGYGLGVFLLAVGLILAYAVQDMTDMVDLRMVGLILCLAGVLVLAITAFQTNTRRRSTTTATTVDDQGRSATTQRSTESDPPAPPAI